MDNFTPDDSQLKALTTWYSKDNPLHLDPRHPCIKLAGEAGELLDLYGKEEYKPNFSWWDCIQCGAHQDRLKQVNEWYGTPNKGCCRNGPVPRVLDELGDYSYYLRILAYIKGVSFEVLWNKAPLNTEDNIDFILARLNSKSASIYMGYLVEKYIFENDLRITTLWLKALLHRLDCSLENLLELNYKKLNTESQHGWANASIKSRT